MIREQLEQESATWRGLGANPGAWIMQEFIVRNGQEAAGRPRPSRYRRDKPKLCFANSARLVARSLGRLRYVEGFALDRNIGFAFHHGWAIEHDDAVVEVTLRNPEDYEYCGVIIPQTDYRTHTTRTHRCVLDTGRGINILYMLVRDPALAEMLPARMRQRLQETAAA